MAELKTSVAMENAEPFQYRPVLFCLRLTSTFWTPEPVPLAEPVHPRMGEHQVRHGVRRREADQHDLDAGIGDGA